MTQATAPNPILTADQAATLLSKRGDKQLDFAFGNWLAGFTAGEGFFSLGVSKYKRNKDCQSGSPIFGITLRDDDFQILETIKAFLGCGFVRFYPKQKTTQPRAAFSVKAKDDLLHKVVPVFQSFALRAKKSKDFIIWKEGVQLAYDIKQRSFEYRPGWRTGCYPKWSGCAIDQYLQLVSNLHQNRSYVGPDIIATCAQHIEDDDAFGHWLAGFVAGEGCFVLDEVRKNGIWTGGRAVFRLKLRCDEWPIMLTIQKYLDAGWMRQAPCDSKENPRAELIVTGTKKQKERLVPLFDRFPLRAKKARDFEIWKQGIELLWEIQQRPRIGIKGRCGYIPKWTDAEKTEFRRLCFAIRETHRYIAPTSIRREAI